MERRQGKVIIHASGGTASKGSSTYKVTLPSAWMKELGVNEQNRGVELTFDGNTISIVKRRASDEVVSERQADSNVGMKLKFYDRDLLCTTIIADTVKQTVTIQNHTDHIIKTAFGNNCSPTWEDFMLFLEDRCIPRTRAGLREYLEQIGVEEYDPIEIIKKTEGRMAEDGQWIKIEVLP